MVDAGVESYFVQEEYVRLQSSKQRDMTTSMHVVSKVQTHESWRLRISGEIYEAVTRCFLQSTHSLAIVGWKSTGSKLQTR